MPASQQKLYHLALSRCSNLKDGVKSVRTAMQQHAQVQGVVHGVDDLEQDYIIYFNRKKRNDSTVFSVSDEITRIHLINQNSV